MKLTKDRLIRERTEFIYTCIMHMPKRAQWRAAQGSVTIGAEISS